MTCGAAACYRSHLPAHTSHLTPRTSHADTLDVSLKIGDLGIACIIPPGKGAAELSLSGAMHGTISHMPPEALGADHTVSRATDIWSFGMLLWELWTRSAPFDGLTPQAVVGKVLAHDLPQWPPKTPPVLEQIASRCWSQVGPLPATVGRGSSLSRGKRINDTPFTPVHPSGS